MKREKKWDKAQKLRALVVDLNVAVKDMEEKEYGTDRAD